jgi:hypothetical protein
MTKGKNTRRNIAENDDSSGSSQQFFIVEKLAQRP